MALHLVKLCVGIASPADLRARIAASRHLAAVSAGPEAAFRVAHVTRMLPGRAAEIVGQGSLYWVMRGHVCARQAVLDLDPFTDAEGTRRCRIVLSPEVVDVSSRPRKMFQGWRYLTAEEAPPDLGEAAAAVAEMPERMRRELVGLGLL